MQRTLSAPVVPTRTYSGRRPGGRPGTGRGWQLWQPGWPLTYLVAGYPLWWLLGFTQMFLLLGTAIMAVQLVRQGPIAVRRGFGWWLAFMAWVAIGILLVQVNAPGAQPGGSNGRYITFTYRYCLYLAATIVLLYIYNFRHLIPTQRIVRAFGWFFVTVVAGGVLGAVAPFLSFPSLMEIVLPGRISNIAFVHTLVHPGVAQIVNAANPTGTPRTSAPFAYTNDWGLSFACLLPFFLVGWFGPDAGARRAFAPWILLVSIYPVVVSQNRGLWIALLVSGVVVCVRSAVFGSIRFAITTLVGGLVAVTVVLATPLGAQVVDRLTTQGSEGGRATLGTDTLKSVLEKSPVVGLGTTRPVQGSYYSIAGGDSAECIGCSPPPLGTQGHFWLVAFSSGYGGLLLYLGFVLIQLFRHIRLRSPIGTLGIVVLVAHVSTMLIYDTIGIQLVIIFAALGLLWREKATQEATAPATAPPVATLRAHAALIGRHATLMIVCGVVGVAAGLGVQQWRGTLYEAVAQVYVPADSADLSGSGTPQTMDTLAQFVHAPAVRDAVRDVLGENLQPGGRRLYVTAKPYSRVLLLHVLDTRPALARRAADAAGEHLVAVRGRLLADRFTDALNVLERERATYLTALGTIERLRSVDARARPLTGQADRIQGQIEDVDDEILELRNNRSYAGRVVATPPAVPHGDARIVAACSGLMLGLLAAALFLHARHARGRRLDPRAGRIGDLPVLGRVAAPNGAGPGSAAARTAAALRVLSPATVLSAGTGARERELADAIDQELVAAREGLGRPVRTRKRPPVVVVAGSGTTDRELDFLRDGMDHCRTSVAGVVLVGDTGSPGRSEPTSGALHRLPWHATTRHRETHRETRR